MRLVLALTLVAVVAVGVAAGYLAVGLVPAPQAIATPGYRAIRPVVVSTAAIGMEFDADTSIERLRCRAVQRSRPGATCSRQQELWFWPGAAPPAGWTLVALPDPIADLQNWELGSRMLVLHAMITEPLYVRPPSGGVSAPAPRIQLIACPPGLLPAGALAVTIDHVTRRWTGDEHREDRGEVTIEA